MKTERVIRLVLVDDHPVILNSLMHELPSATMEIVGASTNGETAVQMVKQSDPDVLVLDLMMPRLGGLDVIYAVSSSDKKRPAVVVFSAYDNEDYVSGALSVGAMAYVLKNEPLENLIDAIRAANEGRYWLSRQLLKQVFNKKQFSDIQNARLTRQEFEILKLIVRGFDNNRIAEKLCLAKQTVKNHLRNIYLKLSVSSRLEAAIRAVDMGFLASDDTKS